MKETTGIRPWKELQERGGLDVDLKQLSHVNGV